MRMNKLSAMKGKLAAVALILAVTLLSACSIVGINPSGAVGNGEISGAVGNSPTFGTVGGGDATLLTACHATGDPANPYVVITVTYDISPVPVNGCPAAGPVLISDGKITICHATGSETNPYEEITVSVNGLNGHGTHEGDVFPGPDGGCPTTPVVIDNSAAPLTVCHATGDPVYPYEELTVVNSVELDVHRAHANDIIPAPANGCPVSPVLISDGKITICHVTGSQTNPYEEITVSVNGLNGHGKHAGDIIPVPAAGCPTSSQDKTPQNDKPKNKP